MAEHADISEIVLPDDVPTGCVEATKDAPGTAVVTPRVVIDQRDSHYRLAVQIAGTS